MTQRVVRRFKSYEAYKESGVEWLGRIPTSWEVAPVYVRYEVALGKMLDSKRVTGKFPGRYLRNVDVQWDSVNTDDLPEMDFSGEDRVRYRPRNGDLLVCEGGEVGRTAIWLDPIAECFYQKAIHRLRPRSAREVPRFLFYLMHVMASRGVLSAGGNPNTIDHLTAPQLRHYRIPFAPTQQQRVIVEFLDRETAKIDAMVAKKQKLIELLREQRTSLITQAVTKGLDLSVRMKDSGLEWLPRVPEHWTIRKIKHLFHQTKRLGFPELTVLSVYRDYGVIEKVSRDDNFNRTPEDLTVYQMVEVGDLVINKMKAWQGSLGVSDYKGIASPDYVVYTPRHSASGRFLHHLLRNRLLANVYLTISNGIRPSQWRLEPERFENLVIFVPPAREQVDICKHIDDASAAMDSLIEKAGAALSALAELRSALISAAVTGKIDVRDEMSNEADAGIPVEPVLDVRVN